MKYLLAAACLATLLAMPSVSRAEDAVRFAPLKAEELTPPQKAWADMIAEPPRNAKFTNPPYRAYIRNPDLAPRLTAMSEYLRWKTSLPPRLSELAILITAREWTAQYEWFAHYPLAIKAGLDPKIAAEVQIFLGYQRAAEIRIKRSRSRPNLSCGHNRPGGRI